MTRAWGEDLSGRSFSRLTVIREVKRVKGTRARANAGAPSVLVAYGYENRGVLKSSDIPGKFICLMGGRRAQT